MVVNEYLCCLLWGSVFFRVLTVALMSHSEVLLIEIFLHEILIVLDEIFFEGVVFVE